MSEYPIRVGVSVFFRQQKFVERAVDSGQLLDPFVAGQIDRVQRGIQRLEAPQIAVIMKKIAQKSGRNFRPLCAAAACDLRNRRIETIGGKLAALLDHALDAVAVRAVDQSILQLLRIDSWRIFTEQRNYIIR